MPKTYTWCDQCDKPILVGMKIWFKGADCYCNSKCLLASFKKEEKRSEQG